ncbi:hypothetical protein CBL_20395, partial [Carabus blaptoides fortunei]
MDKKAINSILVGNDEDDDYRLFNLATNQFIRSRDIAFQEEHAVSFASMGAKIVEFPGDGRYVFKVHGQVYHRTSHVRTLNAEPPTFAQLYVDLNPWGRQRHTPPSSQNRDTASEATDPSWKQHNRLADTYRMLRDVETQAILNANATGEVAPIVNMAFLMRLPVHLPNQQRITFQVGHDEEALEAARIGRTKLEAWFQLNENDVNAREYLYTDIPYYYVYNKNAWQRRQRGGNKNRGWCSLPDIKDGAFHRHLMALDDEWENCLSEAATYQMPYQMRQTFAYICCFHRIDDVAYNLALHDIDAVLKQHGLSCVQIGLPVPNGNPIVIQMYDPIVEQIEAERLIAMRSNSPEAEIIRQAILIIIDEVSMLTKHGLRCIDVLLRELMQSQQPFGGKVIVIGGDFRQTLPVVVRGTRNLNPWSRQRHPPPWSPNRDTASEATDPSW